MHGKKIFFKMQNFFLNLSIRGTQKMSCQIFGKLDFVVKKSLAEEKSDPLKKGVVNFVFFDSRKC